jgi:hypothetical protein
VLSLPLPKLYLFSLAIASSLSFPFVEIIYFLSCSLSLLGHHSFSPWPSFFCSP